MAKASKNLGITKSCPVCKHTFFRDFIFTGVGSGSFKCPECLLRGVNTYIKIELEQEPKIKLTVIKKAYHRYRFLLERKIRNSGLVICQLN